MQWKETVWCTLDFQSELLSKPKLAQLDIPICLYGIRIDLEIDLMSVSIQFPIGGSGVSINW